MDARLSPLPLADRRLVVWLRAAFDVGHLPPELREAEPEPCAYQVDAVAYRLVDHMTPNVIRPTALPPSWFGGRRYQRLRRIPKYRNGAVAPNWMQAWRTLKEGGESFRSIALNTGWVPRRTKQPRGSFSPTAIRKAFTDWGWDTKSQALRRQGAHSLLVRVSRLEKEVRELRAVLRLHVEDQV